MPNSIISIRTALIFLMLNLGVHTHAVAGPQIPEYTYKVPINELSAEALAASLDGIGIKKAVQIVQYRTANGPITELEQLLDIKGIGVAWLNKNRTRIDLGTSMQVVSVDSPADKATKSD